MKNYYEILEVAKNASPEVIEKAYKTLIKKYHPDLQPDDKKKEAENKVKLINEAYDILSNAEKKAEYDNELEKLEYQKNIENQEKIKQNYNYTSNNIPNTSPKVKKQVNDYQDSSYEDAYNKEVDRINAYNKAYNDAYTDMLRSMGYKIRYKKTFKEHVKSFLAIFFAIIFTIILCFILWHIPFIRKFLIDLYNNNQFVKIFVDILRNIFTNFVSLFKK